MRLGGAWRAGGALALLTGLAAATVLFASPASAHATVVSSSPADGSRLAHPPHQVTITFDENVTFGGIGYLNVTDSEGRRVDLGAAVHPDGDGAAIEDKLSPGIGDGTYTASYRVISADSHPVAGTIRFVVGHGALAYGTSSTAATNSTTASLFDVVRWISYGGLALLGGGWLLLTVWPAGRRDRRATGLVFTGVAATAVGAVLELLIQGPYAAGDGPGKLLDPGLLRDTLRTDYGQLHCARLVLVALLAVLIMRVTRDRSTRPEAVWPLTAAVLAVGIAVTFAASGHAGTTSPAWLSISFDTLHVLAMGAWLGGLIMLLSAVLPRRQPDELERILPVFSRVAFGSVVVLAGTGTYAALRGVGSVDAVVTTSYGLLVLGKVVLFVVLVALGNLSRGVVRRRFVRPTIAFAMADPPGAVAATSGNHEVEVERLRRAVYVEVLVGLLVLALTAVLVAEPRGAEALATQYRQPVTAVAPLGGGRSIQVTSDPGTHGPVELTLTLLGGGAPRAVSATATQQAAEIGPVPIKLTRSGGTVYSGSVDLPVAGDWDVDITVTSGPFDATTTNTTLRLH